MDDNIVKFPGNPVDLDVEEALELLEEEDSDSITIVYNDEGRFSFVASNPDIKECVFQLELARNILINTYLNNGQTEL
jgi:hypothetical protein